MKHSADVLGTIMNGHRNMAARMGRASRMHERAGPGTQDMMSRAAGASTSCINCGNHDPSQFHIDYKNGDNICLCCAVVDPHRVMSTEEEFRTFADDTAADKEKKKRSEKRNDGRLGSFIAVGHEKRGQLRNASGQSLEHAHLRAQGLHEEMLMAMEPGKKRRSVSEAAIRKAAVRRKQSIEHIGSNMELHEGLIERAKLLVDKLDECQREHDRHCAKEGCKRGRKRWNDERVAAALIYQPSDGTPIAPEDSTAILNINRKIRARLDWRAILSINQKIRARLKWRAHCSTAPHVSGGTGGSPPGLPSNTLQV